MYVPMPYKTEPTFNRPTTNNKGTRTIFATMKLFFKRKEEEEFQHGFRKGDHVVRWSRLLIYPIQVHGIVLSAGDEIITIVDFGYSRNPAAKDDENKESASATRDESTQQSEEMIEGDESIQLEDLINKEDRVMIDACDSLHDKYGRERINIHTLTEEKEIKCWKKVDYGDETGKKQNTWKFPWQKKEDENLEAVEKKNVQVRNNDKNTGPLEQQDVTNDNQTIAEQGENDGADDKRKKEEENENVAVGESQDAQKTNMNKDMGCTDQAIAEENGKWKWPWQKKEDENLEVVEKKNVQVQNDNKNIGLLEQQDVANDNQTAAEQGENDGADDERKKEEENENVAVGENQDAQKTNMNKDMECTDQAIAVKDGKHDENDKAKDEQKMEDENEQVGEKEGVEKSNIYDVKGNNDQILIKEDRKHDETDKAKDEQKKEDESAEVGEEDVENSNIDEAKRATDQVIPEEDGEDYKNDRSKNEQTKEDAIIREDDNENTVDDTTKDGDTNNEETTKQAQPTPDLPRSDPAEIVISRVRYLLTNPEVLPPHHILFSNSECIAVWCKTGRWSTLQASIFLHSTAAGNLKSAAVAATVVGTSTVTQVVPAGGIAGWLGMTTTATVSLVSVAPWLIPVVAGGGLLAVGTPLVVLQRSKKQWEKTTIGLNDGFWSWADTDVYVEAIKSWSGIN